MKRTLLFLLLTLLLANVKAQDDKTFRSFKLDFSFGYGLPLASGMTHSGVLAIEPKYSFNDYIAVGLRLFDLNGIEPTSYSSIPAGFMSSIELTTDYMLSVNQVRPFVGLGAGPFWVPTNTPTYSTPTYNLYSATTFGVTPRVGVEVGHFRTAMELNVIKKARGVDYSYISIKAGFFLGGGRKE